MNSQHELTLDETSGVAHFIGIKEMTGDEVKNGGERLSIAYSSAETPFGEVLIASTPIGICHAAFFDSESEAVAGLKSRYPNAEYIANAVEMHQQVVDRFDFNLPNHQEIQLHISGTRFQLRIWEALLTIPMGKRSTYGAIAKSIDKPGASRAVGSAMGKNPVAFLIPCHRVVQASGNIGGYMWGANRKSAIISREAAHTKGA